MSVPRLLRALALSALLSPAAAFAQEPVTGRIGVAAPLSGSTAILGEQVLAGARDALPEGADPASADTECTAEGGRAAAEALIAEDVAVVLGFLCMDALDAAVPILAEAGVPVLDVGVRSAAVVTERERNGWPVFQLAPAPGDAASAVADLMETRWRGEPIGLLEDGSIANRGLTDAIRQLLEAQGMPPQAMDNYRPAEELQFGLVRRLARTGVTRFFVAGDRPDVAIIARDAAEIGLDLELIASEALLDEESPDVPLPAGVTTVAPRPIFPQFAEPSGTSGDVEARLRAPGGYYGPAHAAAEVAFAALARAADEGTSVTAVLEGGEFQTALGPVAFDPEGIGSLALFTVLEWDGETFRSADEAGG